MKRFCLVWRILLLCVLFNSIYLTFFFIWVLFVVISSCTCFAISSFVCVFLFLYSCFVYPVRDSSVLNGPSIAVFICILFCFMCGSFFSSSARCSTFFFVRPYSPGFSGRFWCLDDIMITFAFLFSFGSACFVSSHVPLTFIVYASSKSLVVAS